MNKQDFEAAIARRIREVLSRHDIDAFVKAEARRERPSEDSVLSSAGHFFRKLCDEARQPDTVPLVEALRALPPTMRVRYSDKDTTVGEILATIRTGDCASPVCQTIDKGKVRLYWPGIGTALREL